MSRLLEVSSIEKLFYNFILNIQDYVNWVVIQPIFDSHCGRITFQSLMWKVPPIMMCTCRKYEILSFYRVKLKYLIHRWINP